MRDLAPLIYNHGYSRLELMAVSELPDSKIERIKMVRAANPRLMLKEAKEFVEDSTASEILAVINNPVDWWEIAINNHNNAITRIASETHMIREQLSARNSEVYNLRSHIDDLDNTIDDARQMLERRDIKIDLLESEIALRDTQIEALKRLVLQHCTAEEILAAFLRVAA